MTTLTDYAQISGRVYQRTPENRMYVPNGFTETQWLRDDPITGFSAGVYKKGNEIVIGFTGTNESLSKDFLLANIPAGVGLDSPQITQAATLVLKVMAGKQALAAGYGLILSDPADAQEAGWKDAAIKASTADRETFRATLSTPDLDKFDAMRERMVGGLEKMYAYEAFTGYTFLNSNRFAIDSIAACDCQTGAMGLFDLKKRCMKGRHLDFKRRFVHSITQSAHAHFFARCRAYEDTLA